MYVRCVDVTKNSAQVSKIIAECPFLTEELIRDYLIVRNLISSRFIMKRINEMKRTFGDSCLSVSVMFHDMYISYISFQFLLDTFCSVAYVRCIIKFKNTIVIYSLKHISPLYGSDSK